MTYQDTWCHAAQEAGVPHREDVDRKKKMQFSHLCSSMISRSIGTSFTAEVPARYATPNTIFEENRSSHFRGMSDQNFVFIYFFVFFLCLFAHFEKLL